ncbi:methyltransferase [Saccharothrix longispora]|nr:methyltransferase [Saccharothrix longispora]
MPREQDVPGTVAGARRALADAVRFVRDAGTAEALARVPGAPAGLARHLEFTHAALAVTGDDVRDVVDALAGLGVAVHDPGEAHVVRGRVEGCPRGLEVTVLPGPAADGHRLVFTATTDDDVLLRGVHATLLDAGLRPDGGDHDGDATSLRFCGSTDVELRLPGPRPALLARHAGPSDRPQRAMLDLMTGAWRTRAVAAVAELGVADLLADGPRTTADLAARTGALESRLHRLLAFLAALGVFHRDGDRWSLTDVGAMLRRDAEGSQRDLARIYGGLFYRSFTGLEHTVRAGGSAFEHVHGVLPFEHFAANPADARLFEGAMAAGTSFLDLVPRLLDLPERGTVVDVGGGDGRLLGAVLGAGPGLRGIVFDRPHVVGAGRRVLDELGCGDRAEVVAGDFFHDPVPAGADLYLLSRIMHDWADERCSVILRNVRAAMPRGAVLALVERPIREDRPSPLPLAFNVHMMVNTVEGGERTTEQHRNLLAANGLTLEDVRDLPLDMAVLVARATG